MQHIFSLYAFLFLRLLKTTFILQVVLKTKLIFLQRIQHYMSFSFQDLKIKRLTKSITLQLRFVLDSQMVFAESNVTSQHRNKQKNQSIRSSEMDSMVMLIPLSPQTETHFGPKKEYIWMGYYSNQLG